MAFVTRCPYCGAVWLLPDKDTAERGPVRCSSCNHSFDATRELLQVDDALFPNLPRCTLASAPDASSPAHADAFASAFLNPVRNSRPLTASVASDAGKEKLSPEFKPAAAPLCSSAKTTIETKVASSASQTVPDVESIDAPVNKPVIQEISQPTPSAADSTQVPAAETVIVEKSDKDTSRLPDSADESAEEPASDSRVEEKAKTNALPVSGIVHVVKPADAVHRLESKSAAAAKREPVFNIAGENVGKREPTLSSSLPPATPVKPTQPEASENNPIGRIIPGDTSETPVKITMAPDSEQREEHRSANFAGIASILLALILLSVLAAVLSIVFNQKIIAALPQTKDIFTEVCGKVPCPGFFLADPKAFVVSKSTLRPVDESGNYSLDVTIVNGSSFAQAVPWLELELLDDNNNVLLKRTLSPYEYLSDPNTTKSIAPDRSLTIRVSMQTNVTSARCVVTPSYPKNQNH